MLSVPQNVVYLLGHRWLFRNSFSSASIRLSVVPFPWFGGENRAGAKRLRFVEYIYLRSHLIVVLLCHGGAWTPCSLTFCSAGKGKEPSQANVGQTSCLPYAEGVEGAWISRIHPPPRQDAAKTVEELG
jgi:hypothetical protein